MRGTKIEGSNILVTGGAGFVGSFVVEELLKYYPNKIIIIDNLARGSIKNMSSFIENDNVEFHHEDIRNYELLERLISNSDYCFHLAALRINACEANPKEGFDVMAKATFELICLLNKYKIKKTIYSSSVSVYGEADNFPTKETDHPYNNTTLYGAGKLLGEQLLRSYNHMHGLEYIGLRYFNIYGPRMDTDGKYTEVLIKWLDCIKESKTPLIYGDGSTSFDYLFVKDAAKANVAALLSDFSNQIYNVGTGVDTSLIELLTQLLAVADSHLKPEYIGENIVNPVNKRLCDSSKARKDLGFETSVLLESGLKELYYWYNQKNEYSTK